METSGRVRMVIELEPSDGEGIAGVVSGPAWRQPQAFTGWLELLRLLETAAPSTTRPSDGAVAATKGSMTPREHRESETRGPDGSVAAGG